MRKVLFFILFSVLVSSCVTLEPYSVVVAETDFSKFSKEGFLVTTGDSPEKYESVSLIRVVCKDGYTRIEETGREKDVVDDTYYKTKSSRYKFCDQNELINELVEVSRRKGANGVIRLTIENVGMQNATGRYQSYLVVTGLAVKF